MRSLRQKVVERLGGEDKLQGEVTLTENCCLGADGLHFVDNEYEVATVLRGFCPTFEVGETIREDGANV